MIAYIKGKVEYIADNYIIVDVNGIGYKISPSVSTIEKIPSIGCEISAYVSSHQEDDYLYGF